VPPNHQANAIPDDEIIDVCRKVNALKFIEVLPKGFDTAIGKDTSDLSGGQIQRIAIARALLRKPKILLLDEPASALDPESAALILDSLYRLKDEMTIIVIAHNLKSISKEDKIIVLDDGKVIQQETNYEDEDLQKMLKS